MIKHICSAAALIGLLLSSAPALAHDAHAHHKKADPHAHHKIAPAKADADKKVATGGAAIGGAFKLTDHNGKEVTDKDFDGKVRLVYFGFTRCPDICPNDLARIASTLKLLDDKARSKLAPLFITVDPERDTPEVMKTYAGLYHDDIIGLTGTPENISAVEANYKVYSSKVESEQAGADDYMMNHSAYIYLMDKKGEFIDVFNNSVNPDEMAKAISKAVR